jgi:hypothetical protein
MDRRRPTIPAHLSHADDRAMPDRTPGPRSGVTAVRTIKLCVAPTRRQTTLLSAIAHVAAELERSGRQPRSFRIPVAISNRA